jgi:predicted phage terminase large subunit-like protein
VSAAYEPLPLLDFIPALTPKWERPDHLHELTELFERARTEAVEAFATCPPQFGKTEIVKHAIVQRLLDDPTTRIAYGSFTQRRANKISREIRSLYMRAGGKVERGASAVADWRTGHETGGLWAAGVDGSWTGEGFQLAVIDDPIKGRKEAESALERENLWTWKTSDLDTRMHPKSSTICIHTRWHVDDFGGRLIANGYEHHRMPALSDTGAPLWPSQRPLEWLLKKRAKMTSYEWESLYMGRPFARGGRVFNTTAEWVKEHSYVVRPAKLRIALGIDLAYSMRTLSDWSVIVVLGIDDLTEKIYVLDVVRLQVPAPAFTARLKTEQGKYPGTETRWYHGGGGELGVTDFIRTLDVDIDARPASKEKFIRATPVAAAWEAGKILLPTRAEWLDDFLTELGAFTGSGKDLNDDQTDALAAAFDSLDQPSWLTAMEALRRRNGAGNPFVAG